MKAFRYGIIGLAVLGAGAGGLYATGMLDDVKGGGAAEAAEAAETAETTVASQGYFVDLAPLTVPVTGDDRLRSGVFLKVVLELPDMATRNDVLEIVPRLNDALLREFFTRPVARPRGSEFIDVHQVTARIRAVAESMIGEGKLRAVLVQKAAPLP